VSILPFTTSLATAVGRVRSMIGQTDPASDERVEDARISEYLSAYPTEADAALALVDATIASLVRRMKVTVLPDSPEIVQVGDTQAKIDGWQRVRTNLLSTRPTSTGLPVRSFSSLGAHPSDPWRCR
jgi:hypothetical protein